MRDSKIIPDKLGRPIDIHEKPSGWKITPYERDRIYQSFLKAFPDPLERRGILKEFLDPNVRDRALAWFKTQEGSVTAGRIFHFVSQAVATEAGVFEEEDGWAWWVGCSLMDP